MDWKNIMLLTLLILVTITLIGYFSYTQFHIMQEQYKKEGYQICDSTYQQGIKNALETQGFITVQFGNQVVKLVPENGKN